VVLAGQTGQSKPKAAAIFARYFACIRPGGVACVQGELFVVFELWIVDLRSSLEHSLSQMCRAVALA
jgi:hypothetical protein